MDEYLPSIGMPKGFSYTNNFYNRKRYSSVDNAKKNNYQKYNYSRYNNNFNPKQELNNNNAYANNFLRVANTNRDEVNSIKNNTAITYYNKSYVNNKSINNKIRYNNIFPETYNNYYQKFKEKKTIDNNNKISKSYNNIKMIQGNINNNTNNNNYMINTTINNYHLVLPEFSNEKNNNNSPNKRKINKKAGNIHSYSVMRKENNIINDINGNSVYNLKNNTNNFFSYGSIDTQKLLVTGKGVNSLTSIGFNNKNYFLETNKRKRGISTDNKYFKPYKTNNLFNKNNNNNNSKKKICPLCNKEIENYRYRFHFNLHPSKIFDWLFLGCYRNAIDRQEIKDLGINYVLNCAMECLESFPPTVKYCHLKLNDMPLFKIIPYLERATSFINQAQINGGKILVHCQMGISRSTSCVIAYMIKYMGYTAMDALEFIKKKRSIVMPNFGFMQQLMNYEKDNLGIGKSNNN